MLKHILKVAAVAAIGVYSGILSTAYAQERRVEIGTLTCAVEGGSGFIFGGTKKLECVYNPLGSRPKEYYNGTISKYGIDFGVTKKTVFVWAVLAGSTDLPQGAFNGKYTGVGAKASVGAGVGLKLLVGGSDDTIALQPVSVQAQTGVNIALTVERLTLKSSGFITTSTQDGSENKSFALRDHKFCGTTVTFAPGDSLSNIASRCGSSMDALLEANPNIKNINEIKAGSLINVPHYPLPTAASQCGLNVIADAGDTYRKIAKKCKVSLGALVNENPQISFNKPIRAGDKISIPAYSSPLGRRSCGKDVILGGKGTPFENLNDIAKICGTTIDGLLRANPEIENVRHIKTGATIKIPQFPMPIARSACGSHTIARKGETIYAIAVRCKTTPGAIIDLNEKLGEFSEIPAGQAIRIAEFSRPVKK